MTLNGVMVLILRYFTEFGIASGAYCVKVVEDVVAKSLRSLSHLLASFFYLVIAAMCFCTCCLGWIGSLVVGALDLQLDDCEFAALSSNNLR